MYVLVKILVSAIIISFITEIANRLPTIGGVIASLPLVSLLSIIWLYVQGEGQQTISKFAYGVLFGLPSTAVMLIIVLMCLRQSLSISLYQYIFPLA